MKYYLFILAIFATLLFSGCEDKVEEIELIEQLNCENTYSVSGWFGGCEDPAVIPFSITNNNVNFGSSGPLPVSVDLLPFFPPIGNQGSYGTCVAWAAAYNLKTAINAIELNLNNSQISNPANQFSPKDLFLSIDDEKKGPNCSGTQFTYALDKMMSRGVATLQTVPYSLLGTCSVSGLQGYWTSEANQNRITNYRKISADLQIIKQHLANNIPVIIGAKLSDNFLTWNSDQVLNSSTTYNAAGQHAYHAMIISGYDDAKSAFQVVNSWGANWGDAGKIWIGYNYMLNGFSFGGNFYIATNKKGNGSQPVIPPNGPTGGQDVAPWAYSDVRAQFYGSNARRLVWDVFNIGGSPAPASLNWKLYYLYYDAFNANNFGVLFVNESTTSIPVGSINPSGVLSLFNVDINSGSSLAQSIGYQAFQNIYMVPPGLNGYYYLALFADGENVISEQNEMNNIFYTTTSPKFFSNGISIPRLSSGTMSDERWEFVNPVSADLKAVGEFKNRSAVNSDYPNAYSPYEIMKLLEMKKKSGELDKKIVEFKNKGEVFYMSKFKY